MRRASSELRSAGKYDLDEPTVLSAGGLGGHELEWKRFDTNKEDWLAAASNQTLTDKPDTFKLISFNVWFSQHRQLSRTQALVRIIEEEDASCVCLQEATARLLRILLESEYIQKTFWVSSNIREFTSLNTDVGYDSFMLCKPRFAGQLIRYRLTSRYGRKLLLNITPCGFGVATVHLESTKTGGANRAQQMGEIYDLLDENNCENALFCGDLNHCPSLGEQHLRLDVSRDVWPLLHPDEEGWTENEEINGMLKAKSGLHPLVRFDRIVLNGDIGIAPVEMRILGTSAIPPEQYHGDDVVESALKDAPVFVSDHFGVVASFKQEEK